MVLTVIKGMQKKKMNEALKKMKPVKKFKALAHLGKIKWDKDALEYQKAVRDEWD